MRAFSISNLATPAILPIHTEPWLTAPAIPSFPTREAYKLWMTNPTSMVPLFSLVEGQNPGMRVHPGTNPAYRVHGFVADYDSPLNEAEVLAGLSRVPARFPIFAWNRTRRGGVRAVWRFEEPIFYYGEESFGRFVKRIRKELALDSIFPGLDEEVLAKPDQCYAAGDGWTVNATAVIKNETIQSWLVEILKKTKDFDRVDIEIPLNVVKAELDRQFPGRWSGTFEEGARGVRFWDPMADNPTAAIVRKTGMTAFTGDTPFMSWANIFGSGFVAKYKEDTIGRAAATMWADREKNYYRKVANGEWDLCGVEVARRHLRGTFGLSDSVRKGESLSEVDQVLLHLELSKRVEGMMPFPHRPEESVMWQGKTYLNSARAVLVKPAECTESNWGADFPFLSNYLIRLFANHENLEVFLAWLKVWYESTLAGYPAPGQALFIVGPAGTGKSFLSLEVIASIFGGYADARSHFVDGGRFNSDMFEHALWSLDDSTILGNHQHHKKFSGLIKACVANPSMPYEKKYGYSGSCPFTGRFVCTLNNDPISLGILPDTDQSLLDKVVLARTDSLEAEVFSSKEKNHEAVMAELPMFLRWLVNWEIPASIERDTRFGIKAWHDVIVLSETQASSDSSAISEAIEMWAKDVLPEIKEGVWQGNCTELFGALQNNSKVAPAIRGLTTRSLGRHLASLCGQPGSWISRGSVGRGAAKRNNIYTVRIPPIEPTTPHEDSKATP